MKYLKLFESENLYENEITKFFENLCDEKEIPFLDCVKFGYDKNNEGKIVVFFMGESHSEADMDFYTQSITMQLNSRAVYNLLKNEVAQTLLTDFDYYFEDVKLIKQFDSESNLDVGDWDVTEVSNKAYTYKVKLKQNINRLSKSGLLGLK